MGLYSGGLKPGDIKVGFYGISTRKKNQRFEKIKCHQVGGIATELCGINSITSFYIVALYTIYIQHYLLKYVVKWD